MSCSLRAARAPASLAGLLALVVAPAVARAQNQATPLACRASGVTYYPRGDHWAATPTGGQFPEPVQVRLSSAAVDGFADTADVHEAIRLAINTWLNVACPVDCADVFECTSQGSSLAYPNFNITEGATYPGRDGGDDPTVPGGAGYTNVFYFVDAGWTTHPGQDGDGNQLYWSEGTLAVTSNFYVLSTYYLVHADMAINDDFFDWRTATGGCAVGPSTCYDLESVALHEFGHFLGFNHVACTDAVMYASGNATVNKRALTDNEMTGLCAIYPPRKAEVACGGNATPNATCRQFGEACDSSTQCENRPDGASGICVEDAQRFPNIWEKCSWACNETVDCPLAHVCSSLEAGRFCVPGPHFDGAQVGGGTCSCDISASCNNTSGSCPCDPDCAYSGVDDGGAPVTTPGVADLCAPCSAGDQCLSGICVGTGGVGNCTEGCVPTAPCQPGFSCGELDSGYTVCLPDTADTCNGYTTTAAPLNDTCYEQDIVNEENSYFNACGVDLICFGFLPTCRPEGTFQIGSCVSYCSAGERECPDGLTCCYGTDTQGQCDTNPESTGEAGGCFNLRREGETCVLAENSVCHPGMGCFNFDPDGAGPRLADATTSRCYEMCNADSCIEGSTCNVFGNACGQQFGLCCDDETIRDLNTCAPGATPRFYDLGIECNVNEDCDSGLCLHFDNTAACSRGCRLGAGNGCPGDEDMNGDGVADGGFTCRLIDGEGHCWPDAGPIETAVNCELTPSHPDCDSGVPPPSGCTAIAPRVGGQLLLDLLPWLGILVPVGLRRRRR